MNGLQWLLLMLWVYVATGLAEKDDDGDESYSEDLTEEKTVESPKNEKVAVIESEVSENELNEKELSAVLNWNASDPLSFDFLMEKLHHESRSAIEAIQFKELELFNKLALRVNAEVFDQLEHKRGCLGRLYHQVPKQFLSTEVNPAWLASVVEKVLKCDDQVALLPQKFVMKDPSDCDHVFSNPTKSWDVWSIARSVISLSKKSIELKNTMSSCTEEDTFVVESDEFSETKVVYGLVVSGPDRLKLLLSGSSNEIAVIDQAKQVMVFVWNSIYVLPSRASNFVIAEMQFSIDISSVIRFRSVRIIDHDMNDVNLMREAQAWSNYFQQTKEVVFMDCEKSRDCLWKIELSASECTASFFSGCLHHQKVSSVLKDVIKSEDSSKASTMMTLEESDELSISHHVKVSANHPLQSQCIGMEREETAIIDPPMELFDFFA